MGKSAVDEMLDALASSPNVKGVLVARTVDVEKDPRLTSLVGQEGTVERFALGLLDDQAVRAFRRDVPVTRCRRPPHHHGRTYAIDAILAVVARRRERTGHRLHLGR